MSIGHNPKIVRDGLVLALDAASKKNALSTVEVLVVAGGGGGGFGHGGGGAGGSVLYNSGVTIIPATSYNIVVGLGGIGHQNDASNNAGGSSSAFGVTATGGGSGSNEYGNDSSGRSGVGGNGANGGGGTYNFITGGIGSKPTAPTGWNVFGGNNGGAGGAINDANYPTGGGAGADGPGVNATTGTTGGNAGGQGQTAGSGGPGILIPILGVNYYWGGGGGGVTYNTGGIPGNGGIGGGGGGSSQLGSVVGQGGGSSLNVGSNGILNSDAAGGNAGANTGGGGGGGSNENGVGGNGGSGIVIVRYKGSQRATGGTVTFVNGHTIHTFTTSGTFTPNGTPGTGTILTDFSKNGNSTTLINGTTYNSSNGGFLTFDGIDDYGDTGKTATQLGIYDAPYTMIAFFRVPNLSGDKMVFGTDQGAIRFGMHHGVRDNFFYFGHYGADASGGTVITNTWYHGAWVWTTSSPTARLYINGILTASSDAVSFIGTSNILLARSFVRHHNMDIAQTAIYNRALTVAEIKQNFNALRGRFGI